MGANCGANAASELRSTMRGRVLTQGDPSYEAARTIWNGAVDHHPALIAVCETVEDVQAAVRAAQAHHLPLTVLSGGYDWAGRSLGQQGLVIDLSAMKQIIVDAQAQTAAVQGGATAADVVAGASAHGMAAVAGAVGKIGMAGFTLAGGYGPLTPRFGLGVDNLLGAELVLADGRCIKADTSDNPDLFWALKGGGGNFGVVTALQLRLYPIQEVLAGKILFLWSDAHAVLDGFASIIASAPDELAVTTALVSGSDGNPAIVVAPCWSGDPAQGQEVIARLQRLGTPLMANAGPMRCGDLFGLFEPSAPRGRRYAHRHVGCLKSRPRSSVN